MIYKDIIEGVSFEELKNYDRDHIWHPFIQMKEYLKKKPIFIVKGNGVKVTDDKGKEYFDGLSGLCNVSVGHGNAEIKAAIGYQLDQLDYFSLFDFSMVVAARWYSPSFRSPTTLE